MYKIASLILLISFFPIFVQAVEVKIPPDDQVTIDERQTKENLYFAGTDVIFNNNTLGDLAVLGNSILINGDVENSLFIVGNTITVRGNTGHHLRAIGQTIILSGNIAGDVIVAGQSVTLTYDTVIGGDLVIAGVNVVVNGKINGSTRINGVDVELGGKFDQFVRVNSERLTITQETTFLDSITYSGTNVATIKENVRFAEPLTFIQQRRDFGLDGFFSIFNLMTLLGTILLGLLLLRIMPRLTNLTLETVDNKPILSLLWGGLILLSLPILILLLLFSGVGTPIAIFVGSLWLVIVLSGSLFSQIILGFYLRKLFTRQPNKEIKTTDVILGITTSRLIMLVPLLGMAVLILLLIITTGSLFLQLINSVKKQS